MRIRTLALLSSFAAFGCPSDDDESTTNNTTATEESSATLTTTDGSATLTTSDGTESSGTDATLTTTENPESSGPAESSESGSGSSGPADTGSSGSESGGPSAECQNYCDLFQTNCADGVGDSDPYADDDACLAACAGFSEAGLACRTGHLDGSLTGNPPLDEAYYMTHCPHGDVDGTGVCAD